jgi:hypothetical protein
MKQLFIKHTKLCYVISAALWVVAVVLSIHGGHDDVSAWSGIAGIALALLVADATGKLLPLKKHKD